MKILWHLLGECVKTTILLVCSTCTFFFQSLICALFSYISINYVKSGYAATVFCHCLYNVFHCSSTVQFWWVNLSFFFFFFFKFWIVATAVTGFFFFFFPSSFCTFFFFYIYCYYDTTNFTIFSQLLRCQFLISQNKIIKYETLTNHN